MIDTTAILLLLKFLAQSIVIIVICISIPMGILYFTLSSIFKEGLFKDIFIIFFVLVIGAILLAIFWIIFLINFPF